MGALNSQPMDNNSSVRTKNNVHSSFDPDSKLPVISDKEAELLKSTWVVVKDDITKVGVITFIR